MAMIRFVDMTREMRRTGKNGKRKLFSVEFIAFDEARNTGGDIITMHDCFMVKANNSNSNDLIAIKKEGSEDHLRSVHLHLIRKFNNQVVY